MFRSTGAIHDWFLSVFYSSRIQISQLLFRKLLIWSFSIVQLTFVVLSIRYVCYEKRFPLFSLPAKRLVSFILYALHQRHLIIWFGLLCILFCHFQHPPQYHWSLDDLWLILWVTFAQKSFGTILSRQPLYWQCHVFHIQWVFNIPFSWDGTAIFYMIILTTKSQVSQITLDFPSLAGFELQILCTIRFSDNLATICQIISGCSKGRHYLECLKFDSDLLYSILILAGHVLTNTDHIKV